MCSFIYRKYEINKYEINKLLQLESFTKMYMVAICGSVNLPLG